MSLVAHWPLNGHTRDIVGGLDATRVSGSGIAYQDSPIGRGLRFSASDDRVIIPHDDDINNRCFGKSEKFSVSFFYYPFSYLDYGCVIQKARGGSWSNTTMGVWIYSGGVRFVMGSDVGGNPSSSSIFVLDKPPTDKWTHVVCIADGEEMRMYFNGKLVGSQKISALSHPRTSNDAPITIGPRYDNDASSSGLRGILADLKLYDHVLSQLEILENGLGLVSHWPLNNPPHNGTVGGQSINVGGATLDGSCRIESNLPGEITAAAKFDGTTNCKIILPNDDFVDISTWGSVAMWIKVDSLEARDQWIWGTNIQSDRGIFVNSAGYLCTYAVTGVDGLEVEQVSSFKVIVGKWHHVVMSWGIPVGLLRLHADGKMVSDIDATGWTDIVNGGFSYLGSSFSNTAPFNGKIAHFKTFGRGLSDSQISLLYKKRTSMSLEGTLNIENPVEGFDRVASKGEFLVIDSGYYGDIPIYAYEDNTDLFVGGERVANLNSGESYTLPSSEQFVGLSISAFGKPISIGNTRNCIPTRWSGTQFGVFVDRDPGEIVVFSPFADATIEVVDTPFADSTEIVSTITIPAGGNHSIPNEVKHLYFIRSNVDICLYAKGNPNDNRPVYPACKELYGIPSGHADLVSLTDGDVELCFSDGTKEVLGFKRANSGSGGIAVGSSLYTGKSMKVASTGLVCVNTQGDSDGSEIAPFISKDGMATHFLLPQDCLYVAFVGLESNVEIKHYDSNMVEQQSILVSGGGEYPSKARLEGGLLAGHWIVCDKPMFAIMQDISSDDKTILYGYNPEPENVYRENIQKFSENGIFPHEYIAFFPLHADVGDHGPNGFNHDSSSLPTKSDRGFTFNGLDTYLMAMSNEQARDYLGQPETESISIVLSFRSYGTHENADSATRLITRDASEYWGIAVDQLDDFPQRLRWWDTASAYSELSVVTEGWHRLVMVRDPMTGVGKVYLNGQFLGEYSATPGTGFSRPILIGANTEQIVNNTNNAFYGDIEDIHIVKGVISEHHIKADYQKFVKRNRTLSFDRSSKNVYQLIER